MSTSLHINRKRKLTTDNQISHPRKHLRIEIPTTIPPTTFTPSTTTSPSSLFSAASLSHQDENDSLSPTCTKAPALRHAPQIHGLYFDPTLEIPLELAESVITFCMSTYFHNPDINQIMLFTRFSPHSKSSLPPILLDLLTILSTLLRPHIPDKTHSLLFPNSPTQARQVILNLYTPGEGISPHVDLLKRFGDGIIGVSLGSGCVMQFAKALEERDGHTSQTGARTSILDDSLISPSEVAEKKRDEGDIYDLYLPERSVLVLSSDARYKWTHGIEKRKSDFVSHHDTPCTTSPGVPSDAPPSKGCWIDRGIRLSITFRWLLPGADIVGSEDSGSESKSVP
ncbi:hypothetical protein P691DRAFT_813221 [Macrolepiota fuliginosa MF-IS2]|uniref:Fe2OG dioxygenase domain-containing protein n=1 Tax=Macrolepiota fuliginosa MF-IS2 TaxID=1400762 RepID=A0A9P5XDJ9_9AGAR|nr:hypothetical protein P691DRAFT_813221 [Macrolepiota fuliginosa MF-IS2]